MPTAAERIGDFSNYRNSSGVMQPIKDPTTQQVVPGNAFSPSLASPMGAAMLNFFLFLKVPLAPADIDRLVREFRRS